MNIKSFTPPRPESFLFNGALLLAASVCFLVLFVVWLFLFEPGVYSFVSSEKEVTCEKEASLAFSLGLNEPFQTLYLPSIQEEVSFSYDPPRPDCESLLLLSVCLNKTGQIKKIAIPSRIDLTFEPSGLGFSDSASSFWAEISSAPENKIGVQVCVEDPKANVVNRAYFTAKTQEIAAKSAQEFHEKQPFRILAEARWWGRDLFQEKYSPLPCMQRFEIGAIATPELLHLREGEWIAWVEGRWQRIESLEQARDRPLARIFKDEGKSIVLEGWEGGSSARYIRLAYSQIPMLAFKVKAEELFSSLRIRSEKQISCTLEKQCLILKVGDWILKKDGRWKVLRKKEDRDAFLNGKIDGELFVFDRVEFKGGQKVVQGTLYNATRSQTAAIEMAITGQKKGREAERLGRIKSK